MALLGPLAAIGAWLEAAGLPSPLPPWRLLAVWSLAAMGAAPAVWIVALARRGVRLSW